MDHNKEEAYRVREAAITKFLAKDYAGARWLAFKAQSLNPEIVGIKKLVATFAMHLAVAVHTINGEMDYYGVLGVKPAADDDTVKKRYMKLVAMLHPDQNESIGAEEAFKFVTLAWGALSDKAKRAEYDSKRNSGSCEGGRGGASSSSAKRGKKRASDDATASSSSAPPPPPPPPPATCYGSFWTVCSSCRKQYEYHLVYLNQNLLCTHCHKPFTAVETAPHPGSIFKTLLEPQFDSIPHLTDGRKEGRDNNNGDSLELVAVPTGTKTAAHGSQAVPRESTKIAATASTNPPPPPKRRKVVESGSNVASSSAPPALVRKFSKEELRNVLVRKSKPTIVTKLQDLFTVVPDETEDVINMGNAGSSQDKSANALSCYVEDTTSGKDLGSLATNVVVPHPDFFDFNETRTAKSFRDNQIWASYDSSERMPRDYFMIDKVLSVDPFKACITQLTASEPAMSSSLIGLRAPSTCGVFRAGESQICMSPYIFSHKVEAAKGDHGEFLIYPRTGDVWALHKNWSHDGNYLEGDYDVVEVFEGYTEDYGVKVFPLMKVAGFTSVFRHRSVPEDFRTFTKDELSRFSHQIPSCFLHDAADEYRGCQVLDPAATPSQFLRVMNG